MKAISATHPSKVTIINWIYTSYVCVCVWVLALKRNKSSISGYVGTYDVSLSILVCMDVIADIDTHSVFF